MRIRWSRPGQSTTRAIVIGDLIQIEGVQGNVTIAAHRPPYRVEAFPVDPAPLSAERARQQPSRLLLTRHQVVPFAGRDDELTDLRQWLESSDRISVRLLHAPGGYGKTRLAQETAVQSAASGWSVWRILYSPVPPPNSRVEIDEAGGVLLVVDYADRWPGSHLNTLITHMTGLGLRAELTVRVLLLARSAGSWWSALRTTVDSELAGESSARRLGPVAAPLDRPDLFDAAARRFARALHYEDPPPGVPGFLADATYDQILAVHMAALVAVDAAHTDRAVPSSPHALSAYLLERERAYWHLLHHRTEPGVLTAPHMMARATYVATLAGPAAEADATALLRCAHVDEPGVRTVLIDHRSCYPSGDYLEPLSPDRLGEDFIALTTPGSSQPDDDEAWEPDPWAENAVSALMSTDSGSAWARPAISVLVETARRWPHVADHLLFPAVRDRPALVLHAGAATVGRLVEIPGVDITLLERLTEQLPPGRDVNLDVAAAEVSGKLTELRLRTEKDPARRANLHNAHASRLMLAGRYEAAAQAAAEEISIYRRLVGENPGRYGINMVLALRNQATVEGAVGDMAAAMRSLRAALAAFDELEPADGVAARSLLAWLLSDLGAALAHQGQLETALAATRRAVRIRRDLIDREPTEHLPHLARALNNEGNQLDRMGQHTEALRPIEEAAAIWRQLAAADPRGYEPDLAASLNDLGCQLADLGRANEGQAVLRESLEIRSRLAEINPDLFLNDLAQSYQNLGAHLAESGRRAEALSAGQNAVAIYRQLADANPGRFLPGLAGALNNAGLQLAAVGKLRLAVSTAEEAVRHRRLLAGVNPEAHLPELGAALMNLSSRYSDVGRNPEAAATAEEAVSIYLALVRDHPDAHLIGLGVALHNLSVRYDKGERWAEAVTAGEQGVAVRRRIADANPGGARADLALSLSNLSLCLHTVGRDEEGLRAAAEACEIVRPLAAADPVAHLPLLAKALGSLSRCLSHAGRRNEACASAEEAVAAWRRLAAEDPDGHEPDLARSLRVLATALDAVGQPLRAAAAAEEAANIFRRLLSSEPEPYRDVLANVLSILGPILTKVGRYREALAAAEESVSIRRALAAGDPDHYRVGLMTALGNLTLSRIRAGAYREALSTAREAVAGFESLAASNPAYFTNDLASAYNGLAIVLAHLNSPDEAYEAALRVVNLRRSLAAQQPEAYGEDLAAALNNLGRRLSELGRIGEAVAATEESIRLRRSCAASDRKARLGLAHALGNLAGLLDEDGRDAKALRAATEAVALLRAFAAETPEAHKPELAKALVQRSAICLRSQTDEYPALNDTLEAIALFNQLQEASPGRFDLERQMALQTARDLAARLIERPDLIP
ncbi:MULTISPECIES: tetratricopeptide repeat protein [unclassified Micromonospora]|uniref:tetratricopeptide repeat protein n=1 Tax=unclassified Micromonospora TaxID=2617518 RepID=UPI002FF0FDEC